MDQAEDSTPRVLIVEDDPDQCQLTREALCAHYGPDADAEISICMTGTECLAKDLEQFEVVLLDYNLPDIGGIDLLRAVLERADLPVIFITGEKDSATAVEAIQNGAQDYIIKMGDYLFTVPIMVDKSIRQHRLKHQNRRLQRRLEMMLAELQDKNKQLQETMEKLSTMAATDPLTDLANRRAFGRLMERYFKQASRYDFDLSCCMCDLDRYKQVNDTLGHREGDDLLIATAEILRNGLRGSDVAARYGGDEFVMLMPNTPAAGAVAACKRIMATLERRFSQYTDVRSEVTMSIGISSLGADNAITAEELVLMADQAMYRAKQDGRNRIVLYSDLHEARLATETVE